MPVKFVVLPSILLAAVLGLACGDDSPSAPSPTPSAVSSTSPPPAPAPVPDVTALVGVWNLTVRVTEVKGAGCIAEKMRSQMGVAEPYSLSITQKDHTVKATLKSASGDYACTFTPVTDSSGFTTYGKGGFYTCEQQFVPFACTDGTQHFMFTFGEDISGRLAGAEMTGTWDAFWLEALGESGVDVKATFTGRR